MNKVIFSFDFEIGWGDITNGVWRRREANDVYKRLRQTLPEMLNIMDTYDVCASWATVGAMIDPPQSRDFSYLTDNQRSIVEDGIRQGDPSTFNGIDLFESVLSAKTEHQIVCHSYSHIRFKNALAQYKLNTNKFVFPENTESYSMELLDMGIEKVRVPADNFFTNRFLYLLSLAVIPPPTSKESKDGSGLIRHYGSMLFNDAGNAHRIPLLERRVTLGLSNVVHKNYDLHIWAHPFNFAESEALLKSFKKMIKRIAILRDEGKLSIEFM